MTYGAKLHRKLLVLAMLMIPLALFANGQGESGKAAAGSEKKVIPESV